MSLAYYKRFPRDFLEGTIGMSLEVKGAYAVILDLIYMRDGRLPDDARYISGQLGCSLRKWSTIRDALIAAGKITVSGGFLSNKRADDLLEDSVKYQEKQAENRRQANKNRDLPEPRSNQSEQEQEPEERPPSPLTGEPLRLLGFSKALTIAADAGCAYPAMVERIHQAQPFVEGRRKSTAPDVDRALAAALRRGGRASEIWAAVQAFYALPASTKEDGRYASGAAVVLNKDRWREFLTAPATAQVGPTVTFDGPPAVRQSIVAAKDEAFAVRWLDAYSRWDGPTRSLIVANAFAHRTIAGELGAWAAKNNVTITSATPSQQAA